MGYGTGKEKKVVYLEGNDVRAIRGKIIGDDGFFLTVSRREGNVQIAKSKVIKIEREGGRYEH